MADTVTPGPQEISVRQIPRVFEAAHTISSISEERFGDEQREGTDLVTSLSEGQVGAPRIIRVGRENRIELDLHDDWQASTIAEGLGRLSVPNLSRISVGDDLESSGSDLADTEAVQDFLRERHLLARTGRIFSPAQLAGLALPIYLSRQEQAVRGAAGSAPVTVTGFANALRNALTAHDLYREWQVTRPINGTVKGVDIKSGRLTLTPVAGEPYTDPETLFNVEPVKTTGKHQGERQVRIETAATV